MSLHFPDKCSPTKTVHIQDEFIIFFLSSILKVLKPDRYQPDATNAVTVFVCLITIYLLNIAHFAFYVF